MSRSVLGDGIGKRFPLESIIAAVGDRFGAGSRSSHCPERRPPFTGVTAPDGYDLLKTFDAIFIGASAIACPTTATRDILLGTRFALDLYVNYRPVTLLHERLCRSAHPLKTSASSSSQNNEGSTSASAGASRRAPTTRSPSRRKSTPGRASTESSGTPSSSRRRAG